MMETGCRTYTAQSQAMSQQWKTGHADCAALEFGNKADLSKSTDSIVWHLEAGTAYRTIGNFQESNRHFDAAAVRIDDYEQQAKLKVGHEAMAVMSNLQNLPYTGHSYDKIMLHAYKALNYLCEGEYDKARPEVIRAYQCQQDAVEENKSRIEEAQNAAKSSNDRQAIDNTMADTTFSHSLAEVNKNCEGFSFYANYVNPFVVYLDGLYFLYCGSDVADMERARKSLSRVKEIAGENRYIDADLQSAGGTGSNQTSKSYTYVILENGEAASLDQVRIDVPIIFSKVSYVGTAFPTLVFHNNQIDHLLVKAGDTEEQTALIANMDSVIALDFKNEWPVILTKTIASTVSKAVAAYAVNEAAKQVGKHQDQTGAALISLCSRIATAAYQAAVNIADTRSWTTLPKEFQIARVASPTDRKIVLSTPNSGPVDVNLIDGTINVVYVRCINSFSPMAISQFKLK